ncbi:nucleoside triphosphate pyrophosphohydrolase [Halalkalibacter alkalisediminis]|uniref:MazG-like family protein n=1 Tax=Halalkalibacter alkalisediminis TaxID=935616 RepID=A0ABV6NLE1_9BACI|nr:nucleoside triphosphate pyrophosphohydrolase [Halalkalibacter alkalisediminis]
MPTYNKLVRDRIPEIIQKTGKNFRRDVLDARTYEKELKVKLQEEVEELLRASTKEELVEEMADLMEVVYALGQYAGVEPSEIERVREDKLANRGGFKERIFLIDVEDD